jgi:hypothetical protein
MSVPQVSLSIAHQRRVIPSRGDEGPRPDGHTNSGFKNLKGNPHLLDSIPELAFDPSLKSLVEAINAEETGVFSVGCVSGEVRAQKGRRYSGYIEFAFNSKAGVGDVRNYSHAFSSFVHLLFDRYFYQGQFSWELQPAHFLDADIDGFTCSVNVDTAFFPSKEDAYKAWRSALEILRKFLGSIPKQSDDSIY